jgi:hypothetical protein
MGQHLFQENLVTPFHDRLLSLTDPSARSSSSGSPPGSCGRLPSRGLCALPWLFDFAALKRGPVSGVAPVDKRSVLVAMTSGVRRPP